MVVRGSLKILSGLLIGVMIFGIVLGVAGYFAARNFDPNMFRAEFEAYLTQQTGFRVELGDIKLALRPQPQLQVAGLKFYHPQTHEKILQSDLVRMDADLTTLLKKHFSISQVVIQTPEIFLRRDRGGNWNFQPVKTPVAPSPSAGVSALSQVSLIPTAEAAETSVGASAGGLGNVTQGWDFGIGKILIKDASIHFTDQTAQPAFRLKLEKTDAEVRQKGSTPSFHFTAGGSLLGSSQKNIEAEGDLDLAQKSLDLVLRYGPGKAIFKGVLKGFDALLHFEGTLDVTDLDLESVTPEVYKQGNYVSGRLSARAQHSFDGTTPVLLRRSLKGGGTIEIKDGALRNRNVIKEVFDRMSSVLAVTSALGGELPPEISEMLKDRDTPFQSAQVTYTVEFGAVKVSELRLVHPSYQLVGQGTYEIQDKHVESSMQLVLSKSVSAYFVKKIREMGMLADRDGQITIPFRYSGYFPDTSIQPDLSFLASRLLQAGTDELLNKGMGRLSKALGMKKIAPVASADSGVTQPEGQMSAKQKRIQQGFDILSQFLEPAKK